MSLATITQNAKHMLRIVLLPVACLAIPYFPHYLINRTIYRKKLLNIKLRMYEIF